LKVGKRLFQFLDILFGERPRAMGEVVEKPEHLRRRSAILRHQRDLGKRGVAEKVRQLAAQPDDARDVPVLSPFGLPNSEAPVALSR